MTTWAGVHAGDTVRGADQRVWTVVGVEPMSPWLGSGTREARYTLRLGGREVVAVRPLHQPAELVESADHSDQAAAYTAMVAAGFNPTILGEGMTTATADPFAAPAAPVKRDQWGRYVLPDPVTGKERGWTRVSTVARTLADEYNLNQWKLRQAVKGVALRKDLIAGAAAANPETDKKALDEIAKKAMEVAGSSAGANLGTALHTFTQRFDQGETLVSLGVPEPLDQDVLAYVETLRAHALGIRPEWIERIVVLPELGIAGTFDRIVTQPSGATHAKPHTVLDLKTGKDLSYGWLEIAIQQALYAHAPLMWDPATGTYEPMPPVDQDRALVLHLPVGKAHGQLYGINIIEGWEYALLAMQARAARSGSKGLAWLVEPNPEDLAIHNVARANTNEELAELWDRYHPRGLWTEAVNTAAAARWEHINTPPTQPAYVRGMDGSMIPALHIGTTVTPPMASLTTI